VAALPSISIQQRGLVTRISLFQIPIDIIKPEDLDEVLAGLLMEKSYHQIVFLRIHDFMKAMRSPMHRDCLQKAALVIPVSKSFTSAAKKLRIPVPIRYAPFDFVVKLMNVLEAKHCSYYMLGDNAHALATTESNLRQTFPRAQPLGRYTGWFGKNMETNIVKAIAKASPNLLLTGPGIKGNNLWIHRRAAYFPRGVQIWCKECFDYFALRHKRPNKVSFRKGREYFHELMLHPQKIFHFPYYIMFKITLLFLRLIRRKPVNVGTP